jgi:hypothetical protein
MTNRMSIWCTSVGALAAVALLVPTTALAASDVSLSLRLESDRLLPCEAAALEVTVHNGAVTDLDGIPRLDVDADQVTFEVASVEGPFERLDKPVNQLIQIESQESTRRMAAGESDSATFRVGYDWGKARYVFPTPGQYRLRVVLAAPDGSFHLVSDPIDVSIASPTRREAREMKAALATDAYHYVFAPEAIAMSANGTAELRRLERFARRHPRARYAADIPFVAARFYEFAAAVTHRSAPPKQRKSRRALHKALKTYLRRPEATYRAEAELLVHQEEQRGER